MTPVSVEHDHTLPDGTTVHIRELRPSDAGLMLGMWARLSRETIHSRFFSMLTLDESNVRRHVELDPTRARALVATLGLGDEERMIGVVRYDRLDDPAVAEFSALVEDAQQGRGIGTALLRHLAELARADGVTTLVGDVLWDNHRMLGVLRDLGLAYQRRADRELVHASFDVQPTEELLAAVAREEKLASQAALERFMRPNRVAVVGASRAPTSIGGLVFANIIAGGFTGALYPVNPKAAAVQSVRAYPTLSDCPDPLDLVFVCVPAPLVNDVVDEAGRLGVRAVCVISAGFSEAGDEGAARQAELLAITRAHGMRLVGPNCMGLMNGSADVRLNGTFSRTFPAPGRLSFLSQSGALGLSVIEHLDALGLGIATFVSVGNKGDVSGNDLLLFWEDDPDTDVILLYLESFGNPRRFSRVARRISRSKPIVAVKAGRTSAGQRAAASHTAALSAGDVAVDALFRQAGVIRTDTLEEMFGVATLLSTQPVPPGRRVAIVTNGGGPGILAADACEAQGLQVPALPEDVRARLGEVLPAEAGISNPVDMIASSTAEQYRQTVEILADCADIDAVIVIFIPPIVTRATDVADALIAVRATMPADKPLLTVFMGGRGVPPALMQARLPSFAFPEDAARALGQAATYAEWRRRPQGAVVRPQDLAPERARSLVERALESAPTETVADPTGARQGLPGHRPSPTGVWLSSQDAEEVLQAYGIRLARSRVVRGEEEAADAQAELGVPVAVKPAAPIHKSDLGLVHLGCADRDAVLQAAQQIRTTLDTAGVDAGELLLVQELIDDGVEMVVGVSHDPSFGPLVMVGMGGTLVELLRDVAVRITPLTDLDVEEMLGSLRAHRLLTGYRGQPPVDVAALANLLYRVNALVEDLPEVVELDLNPVFVRSDGVVAVDVRMRVAPQGTLPAHRD